MATTVRTRIAPSPTGQMHIGTLRTALYNYAFAKKNKGQFVLRIEDTDQKRFVPGATENLISALKNYGLNFDQGPIYQTQRLSIYQEHIKKLLDKGQAYYCFCTPERLKQVRQIQQKNKQIPKYDRHCLSLSKQDIQAKLDQKIPYVIRLKVPDNQIIEFEDQIRGQIKINTKEIDDQVLIKSDGIPTYHFAVVVDDHLMNITHVMRGDDWISSTPKQTILYQYFDWQTPVWIHLPNILNSDGKGKLSKRHGAVASHQFLEDGYLPEAVLNFLMLLGWNPGTEQEFFTLDEFIKTFSLDRLHKKQPRFDIKKLTDFNSHYIQLLTDQQLANHLQPFLPKLDDKKILQLAPLIKPRIHTLKDAQTLCQYLWTNPKYDQDLLLSRGVTSDLAIDILTQTKKLLTDNSDWQFETIQNQLLDLIAKNKWNTGQFFMVFRVAIAGSSVTPPIVESLPLLGKEKTQDKLDIALNLLN